VHAGSQLTPDRISDDALSTVLALVCTSLHDSVHRLLAGDTAPIPSSACRILDSYAQTHLPELVNSEVYIQGLVAVHHMSVILPRHGLGPSPAAVTSLWDRCQSLNKEDAGALQAVILHSLKVELQGCGPVE
jgi:hypothetical protein